MATNTDRPGAGELHYVTSRDGTRISYERAGHGPAIILVGGGAVDRSENAALVPELAPHFTVYNYDRRGRGDSGDTAPYSIAREIEDIEAIIAAAGGAAVHLYGLSSGGALALEAAAAGVPVARIAVYEVPYLLDDERRQQWNDYRRNLRDVLAQGRRGDAFELFMRMAGATSDMVDGARQSPAWPSCEALAPTLAYDAAILGEGSPPADRLARITQPTLVATGGASADSFVSGGGDFFDQAADAIAASIPGAVRATVPDQWHQVDPTALAPVLIEFFGGGD